MNQNSRTKNSIINSIYASSSQIVTILLSFIVRTVFIKVLSAEYLGINGLFTNIITMLSLADLGIGIAIPYTLYKPLANDDKRKLKSLMTLYSKIYNVIGIVILVLGILITPFLKYIIKEVPDIKNLNLIYILFIVNSACSYFFVYKKLLLDSDQKGYIATKIIMNMTVIKSFIEIVILIISKNYIFYLSVSIIITILQNFLISRKCDKIYPFLKNTNSDKVTKTDLDELKKNTSALIIYRVGTVALNGTDNIIISKFVGIVMVGIYSNYLLIVNAITKIISQIFDAITSSIGNLVVTTNNEKSEDIFYKLQFLNFWLYTFFGACVIVLINPFMKIWAGENYVLDNMTAYIIGLNLYIYGMQSVVSSFRNAYGLFVQGKYRPIIMTIVNIVLSIILAQSMGVFGVILATVISRLFVTGLYDPIIVFKYGFKKSSKWYFITYFKYFLLFNVISIILIYISTYFEINNYLLWIVAGIISSIVINLILLILFFKDNNFKFYLEKIRKFILDKRRINNE